VTQVWPEHRERATDLPGAKEKGAARDRIARRPHVFGRVVRAEWFGRWALINQIDTPKLRSGPDQERDRALARSSFEVESIIRAR